MKKPPHNAKIPASLRTLPTPPTLKTRLALSVSAAMLLPLAASAQQEQPEQPKTLKTVKVQDTVIDPNPNAQPGVPYKAKTSGDERHTRPLAETPQTIQVLTSEQIKDSGASDLREILDAQPGITLGTGENGNAFGDRYIIRGQEARSDVFVDGLRDPGMTIRESFAVEQVEVSKGPNSSFAGRGTAGGAINAITKQATQDYNFVKLSGGFGTDDYQRYTVDANQVIGDQFALRGNLLWAKEDVPDREPADRERKGGALSGLWMPTDDLDIVLDYYRFQGEDSPDVGTYVDRTTRKVRHDIPAYVQESDFLKSDVETYTARVKYRINDDLRFNNLTRYGTTENGYVDVGVGPNTTGVNNPGGVYATSTLDRGHTGWQEVEYFANQSNFFLNKEIANMKHEFIFGLEYTNHHVTRGSYDLGLPNPATAAQGANCITGTGNTLNAWCITDANGNEVSNIYTLQNRNITKNPWNNDWNVKTVSGYIMDTVDLTDDWTLFGGLRYDSYKLSVVSRGTTSYDIDNSDHLFTAHAGVTYKITPQGIVYLSYANAEDINCGESDANGAGYGGCIVLDNQPAADPEKSQNIELGTKWDIFNDNLLLTAAIFQVKKSDVMESLTTSQYGTAGTYNTGENRVRGLELGVTGEIVDDLSVQAGYTLMKSEVLNSVTEAYIGAPLANFAQNSSFAQLKYQFSDAFSFGGGLRYEGKRYVGQPDTAAVSATGAPNYSVPSYTVFDAFASYRFTKKFDTRLNITNLTDKDYYLAGYRSGNFIYVGDARTVRLTFEYEI